MTMEVNMMQNRKKWIQEYKDDEMRLMEQKKDMKKDMKEKGSLILKR